MTLNSSAAKAAFVNIQDALKRLDIKNVNTDSTDSTSLLRSSSPSSFTINAKTDMEQVLVDIFTRIKELEDTVSTIQNHTHNYVDSYYLDTAEGGSLEQTSTKTTSSPNNLLQ